nr:acetyltransf_3 [uncultured bacterium]
MTIPASIQTQRLTLKPYDASDLPALEALLTNADIKKTFMIPDFASPEKLRAMAEKLLEFSLSDAHFERGIYLGDTLIGFINDVEISGGDIELGYVIHPAWQGRGYATEALQAAISTLFHAGFTRVMTGAFEGNAASIRVMRKCGMVKLEKEDDIQYAGKTQHCVYYAITKGA